LPIKHVFLFSFVNKQQIVEFLDDQVPRVLSFARSHNGCSSYVSGKYLSFAALRKFLNCQIAQKFIVRDSAGKSRKFFRLSKPCFIPAIVEDVNLTC